MKWLVVLLATSACGRVAFDTLGDAAAGDARIDAALDAPGDPDLLVHVSFDGPAVLPAPSAALHCPAACPGIVPGRVGMAARFTRTECIHITNVAQVQPAAFSWAVWLNVATNQLATAFGRPRDGATSTLNTFEIYTDATGGWFASVNGMRTGTTMPTGEWHHMAAVFDGSVLRAYVDGVEVSMRTTTAAVYGSDDLTIGCDVNTGFDNEILDASIDEIYYYQRVLAPAEVAMLAAQ